MVMSLAMMDYAKHMVGFDRRRLRANGTFLARRNSYKTFLDIPQPVQDLLDAGFAQEQLTMLSDARHFQLTERGLDALGKMLGAKILEMEYAK
jgi:hypothetical protein